MLGAWNAWAAASRSAEAQVVQLQAARIYYEGTLEEYREGLRSTFDVLFAQNQLRETEIALLASRRDAYVAQATLLRRIGQLDVAKLLTGTNLYNPAAYTRNVERRGALPWDPVFRALDALDHPGEGPQRLEQLPSGSTAARVAPGNETTDPAIVPARGSTEAMSAATVSEDRQR